MALIKCPECGRENVSDSAKSCPCCGFQINDHFHGIGSGMSSYTGTASNVYNKNSIVEKGTKKKSKNVKIFIIAAIAIAVIWAIGFISTRCSWSGCYEKKSSSSSYCYYHKSLINSFFSSYSSYNYDKGSKQDLIISNVKVSSNSAGTYCTGTIKNNGNKSYKFVKLKGSFKDRSGKTVETGDTYGVGSEGLEPGESKSFRIHCNYNSSIESCTVTVYDFD